MQQSPCLAQKPSQSLHINFSKFESKPSSWSKIFFIIPIFDPKLYYSTSSFCEKNIPLNMKLHAKNRRIDHQWNQPNTNCAKCVQKISFIIRRKKNKEAQKLYGTIQNSASLPHAELRYNKSDILGVLLDFTGSILPLDSILVVD